jgi:hypothetical protein
MSLLPNTHTTPETAYVVDDYPYGFRLRCRIRYWLEWSPRHGARLVSQTTNPKKPGEVWNKPRASTYCRFGGAMYLDGEGHVQWSGLTEYTDGTEAVAWRDAYSAAVPEVMRPTMEAWVAAKVAYDTHREGGAGLREAGAAGTIAYARALGGKE